MTTQAPTGPEAAGSCVRVTGWDGAVNAWWVGPRLVRMGRREWLTNAGWQQAHAEGVRQVIDLRSAAETGRRPTDPNAAPSVPVLLRPIEDQASPAFDRFLPYLDHPQAYPDYLDVFGGLVTDAVLTVAEASGVAIVHCSAGRDRTGLVVALGQRVAGVEPAEIVAGWAQAASGINARHRTHPHPHEPYVPDGEWSDFITPRRAALTEFLSLDAVGFLRSHGAREAQLDAVAGRFAGFGSVPA